MAKSSWSLLLWITVLALWVGVINGSKSKPEVGIYELKKGDVSVKLTNWGASIISLFLPDKHGKLADVVLGYDSVQEYMNDTTYFGATVGRVANRIGGAQFTLNGTRYKLVANEKKNTLHGGSRGFSDVVWEVKSYRRQAHSPRVTFSYRSFDGEEGFPGDLIVTVTYALVKQGLAVTMKARALNKATPVNLAHHTYWNLGGHDSGAILSNDVQIFGSRITPVDKDLIPTGDLASVRGKPYDFLEPATIASKIGKLPQGFDINYALDGGGKGKGKGKGVKAAAVVHDKKSGRVMKVMSNQAGVQFYTGNYIKDVKGKGGFVYQAHAGLCLETQGFPDSVNHPNFPSQTVNPGQTYLHKMLIHFSTKPT